MKLLKMVLIALMEDNYDKKMFSKSWRVTF